MPIGFLPERDVGHWLAGCESGSGRVAGRETPVKLAITQVKLKLESLCA